MEADDLKIMKEYPVDFVSFSYYSSSCVAKEDKGLKKTAANTATLSVTRKIRKRLPDIHTNRGISVMSESRMHRLFMTLISRWRSTSLPCA